MWKGMRRKQVETLQFMFYIYCSSSILVEKFFSYCVLWISKAKQKSLQESNLLKYTSE